MTANGNTIAVDKTKTGTKTKLTWIRRFSQTTFLFVIGEFSFYGIFRCPFAIPYVSCSGCPVVQCPGTWMVYPFWIALGIITMLFGRGFCGWGCPGGLVSGFLSKLSTIGHKIQRSIDRRLHLLKYISLAAGILLWIWMENPRWAIPIRIGEFWNSVKLTFQHADNMWVIRSLGVVLFIVLGGIAGSLWCRYICPTGGLLEVFRRFGLFQFRKSEDCTECGLCRKACELNTEPESYNCTNCGDCSNACPSNAIFFGIAGKGQSE